MKQLKYAILLLTLTNSISLFSSLRLPILAERKTLEEKNGKNPEVVIQHFHAYCTQFHEHNQEKKYATLFAGLWLTLATMFGYETFTSNDPHSPAALFSLTFLCLAAKNYARRQAIEFDQEELVEKCTKNFTSEELDTLNRSFCNLNPATPMDPRSLLALTQQKQKRQQWIAENKGN